MTINPWNQQDSVHLRDAFRKIGEEKLLSALRNKKTVADITIDDLRKDGDSSIAKIAAWHAGFDAAIVALVQLAATDRKPSEPSGFRDMS